MTAPGSESAIDIQSGCVTCVLLWKASPNAMSRRPACEVITYDVCPGVWPGVTSARTPGTISSPSPNSSKSFRRRLTGR